MFKILLALIMVGHLSCSDSEFIGLNKTNSSDDGIKVGDNSEVDKNNPDAQFGEGKFGGSF